MCQYSLELYRTTDAQQGETYVLGRFPSGTKGFVAPAEMMEGGSTTWDNPCAVCIKAGAIVSLDTPDGTCHFGVFTDALATGYAHRDGIISAGQAINLQDLKTGTTVTVHMPATDARDEGPSPSAPEDIDLVTPDETMIPHYAEF